MAIPGWTRTESPFHAGELAIQARLGVQEQMDKDGESFETFFPLNIVNSLPNCLI